MRYNRPRVSASEDVAFQKDAKYEQGHPITYEVRNTVRRGSFASMRTVIERNNIRCLLKRGRIREGYPGNSQKGSVMGPTDSHCSWGFC
jgi:hypothetical protein